MYMKSKDIYTFRDAQRRMAPVSFSTMIKPAGSACNLDCTYCCYLDKTLQYGGSETVMGDALLETCMRQYIGANEVECVVFCWYGGCPRNSLYEGLYRCFRHAEPYMNRMRELIRIRQSPSWVIPFVRKRMGLM